MSRGTISVDFDGVIHSYSSGWKGAHVIPDGPVPGAIDGLLRLVDGGFTVAIYSSRSKSLRGRWAMKRWLTNCLVDHFWGSGRDHSRMTIYDVESDYWGDAEAIVREVISWPWFKPAALLTIDDRAITFDGNWAAITPDMILGFKPWNKRAK